MDFFHEVALDAQQAEAMARGLYAVAKVDGMHVREAALVASFFHDVGGGAQALAELERRTAISPSELASAIHDPEQRRLFVKTAILLAWADGIVTPQEQRIIADYAEALGIDAETLARLDDSVKEFLLAHLAHVQNVEATRSVAQKLKM